MILPSRSCKNRPAVVVPVNDQMGIAEEADYDGDKKCGYRRGVLNEEPSRWFGSVTEDIEQAEDLPQHFQWSSKNEWERARSKNRRRRR